MARKQDSCFFQIKLSPIPKKVEEIKEEDTILVLAPFQNIPKIHFENVKVGATKRQNLIVRNPGDNPAQVEFTKLPQVEEGFTFSATSFIVNGHSNFEVQVSWTPTKEGCQRNVVKVINSYNLKLDLVILSKAICPPQLKKRTGLPLKSYNGSRTSAFVSKKSGIKQTSHKSPPVLKPSTKSTSFKKFPTKLKKISPIKKSSVTERFSPVLGNQLPECVVSTTPRRETYSIFRTEENKENVAAHPLPEPSHCKKEPSHSSSSSDSSVDRRKTFAVKSCSETSSTFEFSSVKKIKKRTFRSETLSDSLENVEFNHELLKSHLQTCSISSVNMSFELNLKEDFNCENYSDSLEDVFVSEKTGTDNIVNKWRLVTDQSPVQSERSSFSNSTPYISNPENGNSATHLTDKLNKLRLDTPLSQISAINGKTSNFSPSIMKRLHELDFSDVESEKCNEAETETSCGINNISLSSPDITHVSSDTFVKSESSFPELWTQLQGVDEQNDKTANVCAGNLSAIEECTESKESHSSCIRETSNTVTLNENIFQISPPKGRNSNFSQSASISKSVSKTTSWRSVTVNQNTAFRISPPKRKHNDLFASPRTTKVLNKTVSWSNTSGKCRSREAKSATKDYDLSALKSKLSYGAKKPKLSALSKKKEERSAKKENPEHFLVSLARPSVAAVKEPFTTSAVYYDEEWLMQQQEEYTKWLNRLLTPPAELNSNVAPQTVDVAAIYMESCRQQQVEPAPSREAVSSQYHTQHRLVSLRKAAMSLFRSNEIASVLSKTLVHVDKNLLTIRDDRDLHRDIGLKCMVTQLLLCYNPLWLRIGLETIYGENLHLQSNSDVFGLTHFIANHLLYDPYIFKQHSHPTVRNLPTPGFAPAMKKFTLKKFLLLVYFLDQAKQKKLIGHDPCLFCKNAKYKESREILISFSRELLSGVGDITKHLKSLGYIVSHKQTYLDEFDYAVRSLGTDLRDGIRLCRVMEIILEKWTLSKKLRVPAISRLQKIHNVDIALSALKDAGYELTGDIEAKDICNGHREKTLSLLWQIIYKFQAPRFQVAATRIQRWWRRQYLKLEIARRIHQRKIAFQIQAAVVIQAYWRGYKTRQQIHVMKEQAKERHALLTKACTVIQRNWRIYHSHLNLKRQQASARKIQSWYRGILAMRTERYEYIRKRNATLKIQAFCRGYMLRQRLKELQRTAAALRIQTWYRNQKRSRRITLIVHLYREYLSVKQHKMKIEKAAFIIQAKFRSTLLMRAYRKVFVEQRRAAVLIQQRFRATVLMRKVRNNYLQQKKAALMIQHHYRAYCLMKKERVNFLQQKKAVIVIQQQYRAIRLMRKERENFLQLKKAVSVVQQKYRAIQLMRKEISEFLLLKRVVFVIQQRYHATQLMRKERAEFLQLKRAAVVIQQRYHAIKLMRKEKTEFLRLKRAAVIIQQKYHAIKLMRKERTEFLRLKRAAVVIQQKYHAIKLMRKERTEFLRLKRAAVVIQQKYHAIKLMRKERTEFLRLKRAAVVIQQKYHAIKLMRKERTEFLQLKRAAVVIQQKYHAIKLMRTERTKFLQLKRAVVVIQQRYHAIQLMRKERTEFLQLKRAAVVIQQKYQAIRLMRKERTDFLQLKRATILIQHKYHAILLMRKQRASFLQKKRAVFVIEQWYRVQLMRKERKTFLQLKAVILIQQKYRAILLMRKVRANFIQQKEAATLIQQRYRALLLRKKLRARFLQQKEAAVSIQQWYRGILQLRKEKESSLSKSMAAVAIQEEQPKAANTLKARAATKIQSAWRGYWERKHPTNKVMADVRERVLDATRSAAPEQTLHFRFRNALKMLTFSWLNYQLRAFIELDTVTRLSPELCVVFANHEQALSHVFNFLENSNRANSVIQAREHATSILLNLVKYDVTREAVLKVPRSISIILRAMSSSYGKENSLFCKYCTILWLLAQDKNMALEINKTPKIQQCFILWYKKLKPKHDQNSAKKNHPKNPAVALPSTKPDWCLGSKNVKWIFINQFEALTILAKTLDIKLH